MKTQYLLYSLLLCGLTAPAQAQESGFVFTEEEVARAEAETQQELTELISNGVKYQAACKEAYMSVIIPIGECCNKIVGTLDYTECLNEPDAAVLYQNAQSFILGKHPYSASAGQFADGVLSRSTLVKAKPNLTAEQYACIEHMIARSEMLMQWFMEPFSLACGAHHYDMRKEVQRMARFLEYTKTAEFKSADENYSELVKFLNSSVVSDRIFTAMNNFDYNNRQAYVFYNYFHNRINDNERESWLCYMLLGSSLRYVYDGPLLGLGKEVKLANGVAPRMLIDIRGKSPSFASSEAAAKLSAYMRHFNLWTKKRVSAAGDLGKDARDYVYKAAEHPLYTQLEEEAEELVVKEDSHFKSVVTEYIPNALASMISMDDFLTGFDGKLREGTNYFKNLEQENSDSLFTLAKKHIANADSALNQLERKADRIVPKSDSSRQRD